MVAEQLIQWDWVVDHAGLIWSRFLQHIELTVLAVVIGLAISFPLAVFAHRHRRWYPPIAWVTGLLYTIPSLALFVILLPITGLSIVTAEIGLVSYTLLILIRNIVVGLQGVPEDVKEAARGMGYTLLILIRNIVVGLQGVPEDVKEAARGMGYTKGQLLWRIELPLALPAIMAGIRIATVSTIGLVTVAALIGKGGLGQFILQGLQTFFSTLILLGAVLSVALALVADVALVAVQRWLTPWASSHERQIRRGPRLTPGRTAGASPG